MAAAQVAHRLEHARLRRDVEAGRRLVEHDHVRPAGERHRDRDALLLAAGELVRVAAQEGVVGRQRDLARAPRAARAARSLGAADPACASSISRSWVPIRSAGFSDVPGSCGM